MRRPYACLVLVLALILAGGAAPLPAAPAQATPPAPTTQPAAPAPAVESCAAARAPFRIELEWPGVLESDKTGEIAFPGEAVPAVRLKRALPPGQRVRAGEAVIWLDPTDLQRAVEARQVALGLAQAALAQGQQDLAFLEKTSAEGLALADLAAKRAQEDLDRFVKVDRPLEEKSCAQAVKNAENHLAYVKEELRQLEKMYKADDLVEETEEIVLKRQRDAVVVAELGLERTRAEQARKTSVDLDRQLQAVTLLRDQKARDLLYVKAVGPLAMRKKLLEVEKLKQDQAKAADDLAKATRDLASATLTAPIDGVLFLGKCVQGRWPAAEVAAPKLAAGTMVKGEDVLMTVVDPGSLSIRAAAGEKELALLQAGQAAQATAAYCPQRVLSARLESVGVTPAAPGQYELRFRLVGRAGEGLLPGMNCTVRLRAYDNPDALTVPSSLVSDQAGGGAFVYVAKGDKSQKRTVKVGRSYGGRTEILDGLQAGETVVRAKE